MSERALKPLQEAIFEVYPAGSPGWSELSYKRLASFAEGKYNGAKDSLKMMGVQVESGADAKTPPGIVTEPVRQRMWTSDRGELFQFSSAVGAYNVLGHRYTHFEQHVPEMRRVLGEYLQEAQPSALQFAGQRYINKFLLEASDQPEKYFRFYPRLPAAETPRVFSLQVATENFETGQVVLNLAHSGIEAGAAVYILDIYARGLTQSAEGSIDRIVRWQEAAHEPVRRAFMMALTDEAIRRWWGET